MTKDLVIGQMGAVGLFQELLISPALFLLWIDGGDPVQLGTGGKSIADDRRIHGDVFRQSRLIIKIEGIRGPEIMPGSKKLMIIDIDKLKKGIYFFMVGDNGYLYNLQ